MAKDDTDFDIEEMVDESMGEELTDDSDDVDDGKHREENKISKPKIKNDSDDDLPDGGDFAKDDLFSEHPDWKGFKYFTLLGSTERILNIKFSKIFGKEAEDYENFSVSCNKKKAYAKVMHLISHTANVLLNQNKQVAQNFLYGYYCLKRDLDNDNITSSEQFTSAIVNLFDTAIINEIIRSLSNANSSIEFCCANLILSCS